MPKYEWVAEYSDGTSLFQYNSETGEENAYADIDRDKLQGFIVFEDDSLKVAYHFDTPDKHLIFRRRSIIQGGQKVGEVILVGWQIQVEHDDFKRNVQSLSVIMPNGAMHVIDGWKEDMPFMNKPIMHPHEGEKWE